MVKSTNRSRNSSDLRVRQPTGQKAGGSNPSRRTTLKPLYIKGFKVFLRPFTAKKEHCCLSNVFQAACELVSHSLLARCINMSVDVSGRLDVAVPHPFLNVLEGKSIVQQQACAAVPLRYNYDKPEKPRISRVFGYLARFFILFQTEKSSREVVIL